MSRFEDSIATVAILLMVAAFAIAAHLDHDKTITLNASEWQCTASHQIVIDMPDTDCDRYERISK